MRWLSWPALLAALAMAGSALASESKKLPGFTLTDLSGKRHPSSEILGEAPVLLNFWATWCKPCLAEQPKLKAFHAQWASKGFRVISVSVDDPRTQKQVEPFARRHGIEFPIYLDPNQEAIQRLGGRAVPFNVLVGAGGSILSVSLGFKDADAELWSALIAADLAAPEATKEAPAEPMPKDRGEMGEETGD